MNFLSGLEKFVEVEEQVVYLSSTEISKVILINIEQILTKLEGNSKCFISLPSPIEEYKSYYDERLRINVKQHTPSEVEIMFSNLKELASESVNLYVAEMDTSCIKLLIKNQHSTQLYSELYREFAVLGKKVLVKGYGNFSSLDILAEEKLIMDKFADYFIENEDNDYTNFTDIINSYLIIIEKDDLSIDNLITLNLLREKIETFKGYGSKIDAIEKATSDIDIFIAHKINLLKSKITERLNNIGNQLKQEFNDNLFDVLSSELEQVRTEIGILDDDLELLEKFQETETIFLSCKSRFNEEKKSFSFIIDTNVLLDDPELISRIDKKHSVIIAAKVIDELDKFKKDSSLSNKVSKVIRIIQQDKNRNIKHNKGRPKLLPPDLNEKTPDNLILSVALQYKGSNGVFLTSDNLLAIKAKNILELEAMNLQQFKEKFDQTINN